MFQRLKRLLLSSVLMTTVAAAEESPDMSLESSFEAVRGWLQSNAPELIDLLNPPATDKSFADFENQTGFVLPRSVRAAYAIHNGEKGSSQGMFGAWRWLPLYEVIAIRRQPTEFGINLTDTMIPIFVSGGGDYYYVEAVQTPSEDSEVMEWWHENPTRDVKHSSFAAMLNDFVTALRSGQYVYLADGFVGLID